MTTPTTLELAPRQTLRLRRAGALSLQVLQGRLWVTTSGNTADHFVARGEALELPAQADCVIECDSTEPARVRMHAASVSPSAHAASRPACSRRPAGSSA